MLKYYSLILFILVSCQCKNPSTSSDQKIIQIEFQPEKDIPNSIISQINYIPLETNSESMIGDINKMIIKDDRLYILDARYTKSLFVFDTLGTYLFKIHRIGNGPGEYSVLKDFVIYNNQIVILAFKAALFFNLNGDYLFTRTFEWMADNICINNDDGVYLFQNSYLGKNKFVSHHIVKTNIRFRKGKTYLKPITKETFNYYRFQIHDNSIMMTSPLQHQNKILDVTDINYSTAITFDFMNYNIPDKLHNNPNLLAQEEKFPILKYSIIRDNIIYFSFSYQSYLYLGLHFMNDHKTYTGKVIQNIPLSSPSIFHISNDKLYAAYEAHHIIEKHTIMGEDFDYKKRFNHEFISNLVSLNYITKESNPVIICYSLTNNFL